MIAPPASMHAFAGRTIRGTYELIEFLAEGAFGAVYRSEQTFLDRRLRRVALKLSKRPGIDPRKLQEQLADVYVLAEAMDEMSDAEARGHLVHIYDAGVWEEEGDRAFVVMEFIHGRPLDKVLRSYLNRVPEDVLRGWLAQICRTLGALHALVPPVLHRDLKPNNLLLENDSHIRVVDFGLSARLLHQGYVPGTAGTIAYMAPETSMGESVPASDVYSIGLILYEALTGKLPLAHLVPPIDLPQAAYVSWLYKEKSRTHVTPPSHENRTVSSDLDRIILRCLRFNPSERYLTASDLLDDLERKREPTPAEAALDEGRRLRAAGDRSGARLALERGAAVVPADRRTRFALLRELGGLLVEMGLPGAGAGRLVEAWEVARDSAILAVPGARSELKRQVADAWLAAGNPLQASRYRET